MKVKVMQRRKSTGQTSLAKVRMEKAILAIIRLPRVFNIDFEDVVDDFAVNHNNSQLYVKITFFFVVFLLSLFLIYEKQFSLF